MIGFSTTVIVTADDLTFHDNVPTSAHHTIRAQPDPSAYAAGIRRADRIPPRHTCGMSWNSLNDRDDSGHYETVYLMVIGHSTFGDHMLRWPCWP